MGFKLFKNKSIADAVTVEDVKKALKEKRSSRSPLISFFGEKRNKKPFPSKNAAIALGGKYVSKKHASLRTIDSADTTEINTSWKSCADKDYKNRSQLPFKELQQEWGRAIVDAKRLPRTAHFSNNHIMVNMERTKRSVPAIKRSSDLDAVARWHAETMAAEGTVRHCDVNELEAKIDSPSQYLGENVGAGDSIRAIHNVMIHNVGDMRNMTDRRYKEFGMATARGADGELYLCQIFRG